MSSIFFNNLDIAFLSAISTATKATSEHTLTQLALLSARSHWPILILHAFVGTGRTRAGHSLRHLLFKPLYILT
jgi:hypothetical protein